MSVDTHSGGNHEITCAGIAPHVGIAYAAERDAARGRLQRSFCSGRNFHGKIQVVRERVRGAHRQNRHCGRRVGENLSDVVDGAIAAAGEDRVATGVDGAASFFHGVMGRFSGNQVGFHAAVSQRRERRF
jgi:hypothetical protein